MKIRQAVSELIDLSAITTAPISAWAIVGQALHKPWAHTAFMIPGAIAVGMWVIKTIIKTAIRIKKKNARLQPKRSSRKRNVKKSKKSISHNRRKNKCEYKIPVYLREGKGFANRYEKQDIMISPNSRRW